MSTSSSRFGHGSFRRILALVRKESWQVVRDPSSIAVGIVMPMVLLVLFGYGLSFDLKNLPVALVMEEIIRGSTRSSLGLRAFGLFPDASGQDHGGSRAATDGQDGRRHRAHTNAVRP